MEPKPNKVPLSLTDSVHYKTALRANKLESNRLGKLAKVIRSDRQHSYQQHEREWKNIFKWALKIGNSSGHADLEKYLQILEKQNEEDAVPSYYFMYGMRIGERPQLMKNFLGKRPATQPGKRNERRNAVYEETNTQPCSPCRRPSTVPSVISTDSSWTSDLNGKVKPAEYNQIMIDNKVVTQVPIGYKKSCKRSRNWYSNCSSAAMKRENTRIPDYYTLKHKYILPPVNMFR
ncbi:uncharacterized protein LOC104265512 [Ciona intestinalis]